MSGRIEARLEELGILLPIPAVPVASYVPFIHVGPLVVISGQITMENSEISFVGKLGDTISAPTNKLTSPI